MVPFSFSEQEMALTGGRAVFWRAENALLVADLHLEKASYYAQTGQMLPPYDSRETLERLAVAVRETGARRVYALGDNFHDDEGNTRLDPHAAGMLDALTKALDWVWITGNHDAQLSRDIGGEVIDELKVGGIILRHQARKDEASPEISGHFHPKLVVRVKGRRISRPCAVTSTAGNRSDRMILPAFGAFTGGMDARDPAILAALQPADAIDALLATRGKMLQYPVWRAAA